MGNSIQIFRNPQFGEVRVTITENNEPMFCLADVCKALDLANVSRVKSRLNSKGVTISDTLTAGGVQSMTYINEANLYKCIFQSRKPEAEKFQDWVCEEVLPSIRKTGGYLVTKADDTPEMIMARAVIVAQATIEKQNRKIADQRKLLLKQGEQIAVMDKAIAEMKEKTDYLNIILSSKSALAVSQIAMDYGMTPTAFNRLLEKLKVQHKVNGQWIINAKYCAEGYVKSRTISTTDRNGRPKMVLHTYWLQRGRIFLYQLLKQKGVIPLVEQ